MKGDEFIEIPPLLDWVTATDAADELGLTRQQVNKLILNGNFKTAHRLGRRMYVIGRSEVDAERQRRTAKEAS